MQAMPVFTFANQAGLDMLETTLVALQEISLEKILDEHGRKSLCSEFPQIMQQVLLVKLLEYNNILWRYDFCFYLFIIVVVVRVLRVFKEGYVYRAWGDRFLMREQWHGRCWMKKKMLIASVLCLSIGRLFKYCLDTNITMLCLLCFGLWSVGLLVCKTLWGCVVMKLATTVFMEFLILFLKQVGL